MLKRKPPSIASASLVIAILLLMPGATLAADEGSSPERVSLDPRTPYYHLLSDRSVGDHGEITLDVSVTEPECGIQLRFDHAELEVLRNRFGDAQFVRLPELGCATCEPIQIRWMHEPTGYVEFNVNVFRREVSVPCAGGSGG
jgi:hypothetical protein